MELKIKEEMQELQFGFKFLQSLNEQFVTEQSGMKIDAGLINAQVALSTLDPIGLVKILKATLSHLKPRPNDEQIFNSLSELLEDEYKGDLEKLVDALKTEMGKQPIIKASFDRIERRMETPEAEEM